VELTVSQIGDALQVLLERKVEGLMTRREMRLLAERLLEDMLITQERNRSSRESHRRRRVKELRQKSVRCTALPCCDLVEVAL
jgi:hypothetical protein